ncbi:MAG: PilZ domain-containing protein [Candidatus Eremiobacteraeota bacterium]|nr:PilZ domain-containing protein [Candidatus Eremiobacteraeota bacterium]
MSGILDVVSNQQNPARRHFARARVDFPVSYSIVGQEGLHDARVVDLSAAGVRITDATELEHGTSIALQFYLPKTRREIAVVARIVLSFFDGAAKRYAHGVAFTQIAKDDQAAIDHYVHDIARSKLHGLSR